MYSDTIDPQVVSNIMLTINCPRCHARAFRERGAHNQIGTEHISAECTECTWRQTIKINQEGVATTIPNTDFSAKPADWRKNSTEPNRGKCKVLHCKILLHEGGLCLGHFALWKRQGSPERDGWIAQASRRARDDQQRSCSVRYDHQGNLVPTR